MSLTNVNLHEYFCRLRSPKSPDKDADMGTHSFTYAVMPFQGIVKTLYFENFI